MEAALKGLEGGRHLLGTAESSEVPGGRLPAEPTPGMARSSAFARSGFRILAGLVGTSLEGGAAVGTAGTPFHQGRRISRTSADLQCCGSTAAAAAAAAGCIAGAFGVVADTVSCFHRVSPQRYDEVEISFGLVIGFEIGYTPYPAAALTTAYVPANVMPVLMRPMSVVRHEVARARK